MPLIHLDNLQPFQAVNLLSDPGRIAGPKVIPSCMMIRIDWTLLTGKVGHNVMYAAWSGSPSISTTLADSLKAAFVNGAVWTTLAAFIPAGTSLKSVTLLDVRNATSSEVVSTSAAVPGSGTGNSPGDELAVVLTLKTANRGPSGRGRIYVPMNAQGTAGPAGVISAGAVSALSAWGQSNLKAAIDSQVGPMSLGLPARAAYTSPITGRSFPARAAQTLVITQTVCRNNTWDTQRRRGLK